ncbi:hypothetical protein Pcinc_018494, partial [Petrolisthes cinctipes]
AAAHAQVTLPKAFGAGADFVMMGGMLAGHDQSGGEVIERDGRKLKQFYGMSSATRHAEVLRRAWRSTGRVKESL